MHRFRCAFGIVLLWRILFLSIHFYYVYQIQPLVTHLISGSMPVIDVEQHVGEQQ